MKTSDSDKRTLRTFAIAGLLMALAGIALLVFLWSQPCTLLVNPGCGAPKAQLFSQGSWISSPTSLTLNLLNSGPQSTSLSSYYVHDSTGHVYAAPGWIGPTIQPNMLVNVTFTIDGKDFTFQPRSGYSVTVHDSVGYVVTFSVTT